MSSAGDAITKYSWGDGKKQASRGNMVKRLALKLCERFFRTKLAGFLCI